MSEHDTMLTHLFHPSGPAAGRRRLKGLTRRTTLILLGLSAIAGCDRDDPKQPSATAPATSPAEAADNGPSKNEGRVAEAKLTAAAVARYGLKVDRVTRRRLVPTTTVPGRVQYDAERMAHVGVAVGGRVAEVKVRLGDAVAKGDLLAIVDSPELGEAQSEYLQKRTALSVARPAVDLAQAAYDRADRLMKQNQGLSITEVQRRQGELQAARGGLQAAEASVVAAESKLQLLGMTAGAIDGLAHDGRINSRYEVRSPIDGQVVRRDVTLGEFVRPDRESFILVVDLSSLWVIADVAQATLPALSVGDLARVVLPAGSDESGAGHAVVGRVSYISPQMDSDTRTGQVRIEVKSANTPLRAGMFVRVAVEMAKATGAAEPVLAVPDDAVQTVDGRPVVFVPVQGEANTFAKRVVTVADPVGPWVPVVAGLAEGQEVVSAGSFILKAELGKSSVEED